MKKLHLAQAISNRFEITQARVNQDSGIGYNIGSLCAGFKYDIQTT